MTYTKEEKETLFNFLQLTDRLYNGYKRKEFSVMPLFTDDSKEKTIKDKDINISSDNANNSAKLYNSSALNNNSTPPVSFNNNDQDLIDDKGLSANQLAADIIIARLGIKPIEGIEVYKAHHKGSYISNSTINNDNNKSVKEATTTNEEYFVNTCSDTRNNSLISEDKAFIEGVNKAFENKDNLKEVYGQNNSASYNCIINEVSSNKVKTTPVSSNKDNCTTNTFEKDSCKPHLHNRVCNTIEEFNEKIKRCSICGLSRTRINAVPGEGVYNPDVLVIVEVPGEIEDMEGRPSIGKAGELLDRMLNSIYLDRQKNCYITSIVKCRPPHDRNPFPDEEDTCVFYLEKQIDFLKPKIILCFDEIAIEKLLNRKMSIHECHGQFFTYKNIPIMLTYNPNVLLRNEYLKRPAWEDLKNFSRKLDYIKVSAGEKIDHVLKCLKK